MLQVLHVAVFWAIVIVAIRVAVCFPDTLFARILFSEFGPEQIPNEPRIAYLLRGARFGGSWILQTAGLFVAGWVALGFDASLADSLFFLVLWAVVIPALGCIGLCISLWALIRLLIVRWFSGMRSVNEAQA
jgi:hypothetical protein